MAEDLNAAVASAIQGFDVGEIVELFVVDATASGSEIFAFTSGPVTTPAGERIPPSFGGQLYSVFPVESEGWEWSGQGPIPTPTITVNFAREDADVGSGATLLLAALVAYDDFIGATVIRVRTLREHLDDGDDPNGDAYISREVYVVEQKTGESPTAVSFRLRAAIDQEAVQLPRRRAIDRCQLIYRIHDGAGGFSYAAATCPYVGAAMYDAQGAVVAAASLDVCAKNLADCKLRFGANAELPFGGFPAIGRTTL